MPYLIDGHNLIPAVPGLRLADPDDESRLIDLLGAFCARTRSRATVYFDRGLLGSDAPRGAATVTIRFVRPPRTADDAIAAHVRGLRGEARNWTVVSSDGAVQRSARLAGARVMASPTFADRLLGEARRPSGRGPEVLSNNEEEIAYWERRFKDRRQED
jgi:hypothetical protein